MPPAATEIAHIPTSSKGEGEIHIASLNCKNLKTSAYIIEELLKQHQIILIQEHWLFEAQINTIGDLNKNINFVGKGVDKYNPVLPKSMPREYGGVAIIWRENIDHLIKILPDGTERIQCVEINSNNDTKFLVASVYLPSKGSHDYVDEFYDCIDQLYEIYQKYQGTHKIIIGGDLNEDLNNEKTNKRNKYLLDFIKECGLSYDNSGKTFIKPNGEECSELDYFLHTINYKFCTKKEVLNNTITNVSDHHPVTITIMLHHDIKSLKEGKEVLNNTITNVSDHHPVKMTIMLNHNIKNLKEGKNSNNRLKVKWEKVDIDLYKALTDQSIDALSKTTRTLNDTEHLTEKICTFMNEAATKSTIVKARYSAKPKYGLQKSRIY
jgi:hypothetical protein